jgi:hypothetical protein
MFNNFDRCDRAKYLFQDQKSSEMKKVIFIILILLSTQILLAQTENKVIKGKTVPEPTVQARYTCPLHPEVSSDKPGICGKCGMELAKKKMDKKQKKVKAYDISKK